MYIIPQICVKEMTWQEDKLKFQIQTLKYFEQFNPEIWGVKDYYAGAIKYWKKYSFWICRLLAWNSERKEEKK